MTLQDQLEKFRRSYPGIKVMVYPDCLVYTVTPNYSDIAAKGANSLIKRLGLDLIAVPDSFITGNSFIIKSK